MKLSKALDAADQPALFACYGQAPIMHQRRGLRVRGQSDVYGAYIKFVTPNGEFTTDLV